MINSRDMRNTALLFIGLLASVVSIVGCASNKPSHNSATGFVAVTCPTNKSLVYLYRTWRWHPDGDGITMCVNDTPVVALHGRQYCPLVLEPGSVSLSHESGYGPYGTITGIIHDLQVQLEPGQTYYAAYRFVGLFHNPSPTLVLVDEATGTNEMSICSMKNPLPGNALQQPGKVDWGALRW